MSDRDRKILNILKTAEAFVADELETRERSYLPEVNSYIRSARRTLKALECAIDLIAGKKVL